MKKKASFAYLRDEKFTLCTGGDCSKNYPITYTLEEALEDQCDHVGWGFIKILNCYQFRGRGAGEFSYEIEAGKLDKTKNSWYAETLLLAEHRPLQLMGQLR